MMPDTIARLEKDFAKFPILWSGEQVPDEEIDQAEREVGVPFPADFREFIRRYGAAMPGPYPIFGLRPAEVMGITSWNVVDVTRHYRNQGWDGTDEWVIVSDDHAGNPVGIDRDGAVWLSDHDFGGIHRVGVDFEDYLRTRCLRVPEDE